MPRKPASKDVAPKVPAQLPGQMSINEFFERVEGSVQREDVDWSALDQFPLGELVVALLKSDAGVMLRSSDRGRACSIGVFVGGVSKWTTCVDQRELLAVLHACAEKLESVAGAARAPRPTKRATRALRTL